MLLFQLLLLFTTLFYPHLLTSHALPLPTERTGDAGATARLGWRRPDAPAWAHCSKDQPRTMWTPQ